MERRKGVSLYLLSLPPVQLFLKAKTYEQNLSNSIIDLEKQDRSLYACAAGNLSVFALYLLSSCRQKVFFNCSYRYPLLCLFVRFVDSLVVETLSVLRKTGVCSSPGYLACSCDLGGKERYIGEKYDLGDKFSVG